MEKTQYNQSQGLLVRELMKQFRPSPATTGVLSFLALGFVVLGTWQLQRAEEKALRIGKFTSSRHISDLPEPALVSEFSVIDLTGQFDGFRHVMADNQVYMGRTGVHIYSLFHTQGGAHILVNRGWKPLSSDRVLPTVETVKGTVDIRGRLGSIPVPGRQLGAADVVIPDQWPQLLTYPELAAIEQALDERLYPWVLFLDKSSPLGFEGRDWKPVFMTPEKHRAYAFQWFALALTCVLGWVLLGLKRGAAQ